MYVSFRGKPITSVFFILCLMNGCGDPKSMGHISFPNQVKQCYGVDVFDVTIGVNKTPKVVFYFDSKECSSCVIGRLSSQQGFLKELDPIIEVYFLFAPAQTEIKHVERVIASHDLTIPFYIDHNNQFITLNRIVRKGLNHHYLLLDSSNNIIDQGIPTDVISSSEYVKRINALVSENR